MTIHTPLPAATDPIHSHALDRVFREARTHNGWLERPVPEALVREAVELAKIGPTSANVSPMRIVLVTSPEAKARLKPALAEGNVAKTMSAPITAIVGYDLKFYDQLPKLFPHADARAWFVGNEAFANDTAYKNGTLQVAYFLMALRAVGLDTGPLTGFYNAKVDAEFFPGGNVKSNVIVNIGYGDATKLFPRSLRLSFDEIVQVV